MDDLATPTGLDQLIAAFGDPRQYVLDDGRLSPSWEASYITRVTLPAPLPIFGSLGAIALHATCHVKLAEHFERTLQQIFDSGLWPKLVSYGGGFCWRPQRGSAKISTHAWGIAWDFDPEHNELNTYGTMDGGIVTIFEDNGFLWGGHFHGRKDPMHFEFCRGY